MIRLLKIGGKMSTFNTNPVKIPLLGHGLEIVGMMTPCPEVTGTFDRKPVTGKDGKEYAVFTVQDNGETPSDWAGTYRINLQRLKNALTDVSGQLNPEIFVD